MSVTTILRESTLWIKPDQFEAATQALDLMIAKLKDCCLDKPSGTHRHETQADILADRIEQFGFATVRIYEETGLVSADSGDGVIFDLLDCMACALAPFTESGSYLEFEARLIYETEFWRYVFDDGQVAIHAGDITFNVPETFLTQKMALEQLGLDETVTELEHTTLEAAA